MYDYEEGSDKLKHDDAGRLFGTTTNLKTGTSIYTFSYITIFGFAKCLATRTCIHKVT